ncbi:capsule-associated protein CAP1 [Myotisia sp. PD_48]|nr:capsule-associated protein CAP1 [Myotisia sp. PD_48]
MRNRRRNLTGLVLAAVLVLLCLASYSSLPDRKPYQFHPAPPTPPSRPEPEHQPEKESQTATYADFTHPIAHLLNISRATFENAQLRQSSTLEQAVEEYRRRYGLHPPPNFDIWFKFAKSRDVQMIDEYDTIHEALLPFWAVPPKTLRGRVAEAIGFNNELIGLLIRDGKVIMAEGGGDSAKWKRDALTGMMSTFVKHLPDMDLAFNVQDEPRVVIPHEDLGRLVAQAKSVMDSIGKSQTPRNSWSARPGDLNKGDRIEEVRTTRFNVFAHQSIWTNARLSCPPDSPARALDDSDSDDTRAYQGQLGFVSNVSASSDICLTPSLRHTFGFFDRPNAMNVVHDLFPIFSQSKISSYQDILYPSPWYWTEQVAYDPQKDRDWNSKKNQMYWRGSTTGGFSRAGGWRRQHRQRFVGDINALGNTFILGKNDKDGAWVPREIARQTLKELFDVKFSHVGQCDPEDCEAQKEYFDIVKPAAQHDAFEYKHLVDIDGNAFSGRYYAFLLSNSMTYKLSLFREWHNEWLYPWVHYIPLSLKGSEHYETMRYFASEAQGKAEAMQVAQTSQDWARKVLRNQDLEVWFFRLLLEYGRVIDDNREQLGFTLH